MAADTGPSESEALLEELLGKCKDLWESTLSRTAPESPMNALWNEHLEIRQKLEAICDLQKRLSQGTEKPESDRKAALDAFMNWANRMQIERRGVAVSFTENVGFELQTTEPVDEGVDMISVPRNAIFSWDQARKSTLLKKCFDRDIIVRTMDNVALALMLCCQKLLPDSYWHPYFDILPLSFDTPLYFSIEQLQSLRPSPAFEDSLLLFRNVSRQFLYFLLEAFRAEEYKNVKRKQQEKMQEPPFTSSPFTPSNFTFGLYRWSVACVSTRVNIIPSQDLKDGNGRPVMIPCLIPMLDMANHEVDTRTRPPSVYFSVETDAASITAVRNYNPNEVVRIYYGKRSSSDFLLHNGFVPDSENVDDSFKFKLGFPKKNELYEARMKMMQEYGYRTNSSIFYFDITASEPHVDKSLIYCSRVFVLEKPGDGAQAELENPNTVRKAWDFLRKRFELMIASYGNLEDVKPTNKKQSAVLKLKQNECKIFRRAMQYCDSQISLIERRDNNSAAPEEALKA